MGAGAVGEVIGGFLVAIVLPVIILIICNFISAAKRNPGVVYGICEVIAVAMVAVGVNGGTPIGLACASGGMAVAFLAWGYFRAAKKVTAAKSA